MGETGYTLIEYRLWAAELGKKVSQREFDAWLRIRKIKPTFSDWITEKWHRKARLAPKFSTEIGTTMRDFTSTLIKYRFPCRHDLMSDAELLGHILRFKSRHKLATVPQTIFDKLLKLAESDLSATMEIGKFYAKSGW